jgi:hypothetical protein
MSAPRMLGPLPVQVLIGPEDGTLRLTNGERTMDLEVDDPWNILMELGLILVEASAAAPPSKRRRQSPRQKRRPAAGSPGPKKSRPLPTRANGRGPCARKGCAKTFEPRIGGRPQIYCTKECGSKARAAEIDAAVDADIARRKAETAA